MADVFGDLFNSLFFTAEAWGLLVVAFVIVVLLGFTARLKEATVFCVIGLVWLGIEYLSRPGGLFMWHALLTLTGAFFVAAIGFGKFMHERG